MKSILPLVLIFLSFLTLQAESSKTVRLFILSGQSNAGGNGNGDELKQSQKELDPEVLLAFNSGQFMTMAPIKKNKAKFKIQNSIFGTELSFSKKLKQAYPNDIIAICKVGIRGGTSIVAWEKDRTRPGWKEELKVLGIEEASQRMLYQEIIDGVNKGIENLKNRKDVKDVIIFGMWWCQTERDSSFVEFSKAYEKNLTNFINNLRQDFNTPRLPFLFFDQHIKGKNKLGRDELKKSLRKVNENVAFTALVESEDLPTYEGVHFTTEGILVLGERFAEAYLKMKK